MTTSTSRLDRAGIKRATEPPRERLLRTAPFRIRADASGDGEPNDGLTLDGYAAVFDEETLIDSWEGRFWESLAPGSMKKTFREQVPRVQFDHGRHPMIGSIPIATVRSVAEESDPVLAPNGGAHLIARIFDNWLMAPVRDAIAAGAINGMSFRFSVVREQWTDADGKIIRDMHTLQNLLDESWLLDVPDDQLLHRSLKEVRVPELGPVVWPAYEGTSVGVRSQQIVIDLAAARHGDSTERRKLAEALYAVDSPDDEDEAARQPSPRAIVDEAPEDAPDTTAHRAAGVHPEPQEHDAPVVTAPSADSHPSPRRDINRLADRMRSKILEYASQDPTQTK